MKGNILGIDLGGTNLRGGLVKGREVKTIVSKKIDAKAPLNLVLEDLVNFIEKLVDPTVQAIGIGVPGLEDNGVVYDVVNIPAWKKVPLKILLEDRFQLPVVVNNDANCFALGEYYFGLGQGYSSMIGLVIGTGLGAGIIINKKLYSGNRGGAGEFGMIPYLDHCYEYYASGQFFENLHGTTGEVVFKNAQEGNTTAINMYEEMGTHLGNAIKTILYAYDIELIVLGGWAVKAFPYFEKTMWEQINSFAFNRSLQSLQIKLSQLSNSGIFGAAASYYNSINESIEE
ncbi:MAG: ROK family protein [Flavisolibacter sp.]